MDDRFVSEIQVDFSVPEDWRLADEAVAEYDAACDAYDGVICGADGIPKNSHQSSLINKNALETRGRLISKYGITSRDFQEAIKRRIRRRR